MSLDPEFLELASTSVTVEPLSTHNTYGAPVFGAAQTFPARVEYGSRVLFTRDGREVVAKATVYVLSTSASIGEQDRITLPLTSDVRLLEARPVHDEEGLHHWELITG